MRKINVNNAYLFLILISALLSFETPFADCLEEFACAGFDMRNSPLHFLKMNQTDRYRFNSCTVIEGDVHLILMTDENLTSTHFMPVSFPRVREITGYLLVFQLRSLPSLSILFPELRVIRAEKLIHNYGLVLFQNPNLLEVGLPKLTEISRGGVRITDNSELCNADTINWRDIMKQPYPTIVENNKQPNMCADKCDNAPNLSYCTKRSEPYSNITACWNAHTCQTVCPLECKSKNLSCNFTIPGICCHKECIGGCVGPTDADCYACKNVHFKNRCLEKCPAGYYKFLNRRCITKDDCLNKTAEGDPIQDDIYYKPIEPQRPNDTRLCHVKCPKGWEEKSRNRRECVKCPEKGCTKKCNQDGNIQSLSDAEVLKGCNILNGALDISIHSGLSENVVKTLEEYLSSLREVRKFVKISFTPSFVSLNMLKNLRVIHGEELWNGKYALSVFENANLAKLWNYTNEKPSEKLQILRGTVQFHNNPQLCYRYITDFIKTVNLEKNITEHDVSKASNGNKAVCEEVEIRLKFVFSNHELVVFHWDTFNTSTMDHRMFLGYQLYYKKVDVEKVNIYESRDACSDSWKMHFYETGERGGFVGGLKPYTLYAFYVRTLTVNSPGAKGGISDVVFERTKFDAPSQVLLKTVQSISHDSIYLEWDPPRFPNGQVTHYMISYVLKVDELPKERNYCTEPPDYNNVVEEEKRQTNYMQSIQDFFSSADSGSCSKYKCCRCKKEYLTTNSTKRTTSKTIVEKTLFEDSIHNIVFKSNRKKNGILPESTNNPNLYLNRKKRSVDEDFNNLGNHIHNDNHNPSTSYINAQDIVDSTTYGTQSYTSTSVTEPRTETYGSPYTSLDGRIPSVIPFSGNDPDSTNATTKLPGMNEKEKEHAPVVINVTSLNHTLTDLKHFSSYEIKIWACQNVSVKDNFCSRQDASHTKRTKPIASKDTVDESTIKTIAVHNEHNNSPQMRILWSPPEDPNGLVLSYELEYVRDGKVSRVECITSSTFNQTLGLTLSDLVPGNYSVRIRAVTLAQRGPYTRHIYFSIPYPYRLSDTTVILLAVGCSAVALIIGILAVFFGYKRRLYKKMTPDDLLNVFSANPEYLSQIHVYSPDEWELNRKDIEVLHELGHGSFGMVYRGFGKRVKSVSGVEFGDCAVKKVHDSASIYDKYQFLHEASHMKKINTSFIIKLYGVVSEGQPVLVVMELMENGNLRDFLLSRRPDAEENVYGLSAPSVDEMIKMALEIADGMAYLEELKFCHRDLAARNCMVAKNGTVKVGDFGMTRNIYSKSYYRPLGRRLMPVRWMSPEAIKDARFTPKSDVWSYGVVLWEIVTLAMQPYPGMSTEDVMKFVVDQRLTLHIPNGCPRRLEELMGRCWQYDQRDRASFLDILAHLEDNMDEGFRRVSYYHNQRGKVKELSEKASHDMTNGDIPGQNSKDSGISRSSYFSRFSDDGTERPHVDGSNALCNNNRRLRAIKWLTNVRVPNPLSAFRGSPLKATPRQHQQLRRHSPDKLCNGGALLLNGNATCNGHVPNNGHVPSSVT